MKTTLEIDDKWSVEFDPKSNDRPLKVLRHGEEAKEWVYDNFVTAMFYSLLAETERNHNLEEALRLKLLRVPAVPLPPMSLAEAIRELKEAVEEVKKLRKGEDQ